MTIAQLIKKYESAYRVELAMDIKRARIYKEVLKDLKYLERDLNKPRDLFREG